MMKQHADQDMQTTGHDSGPGSLQMKHPLRRLWETFAGSPFNYFLAIIVGMILVSPFFPPYGSKNAFPVAPLVYTIGVILMLRVLVRNTQKFVLYSSLYVAIFIMDIVLQAWSGWEEAADLVGNVLHIVVLALFCRELLVLLFETRHVTMDSIKGGIAVYFLMGLLWGLLYRVALFFDAGAFFFYTPGRENLFYFSYTTLTTLGYGDIVPANRITEMLASMESVVGQVFLAVFMARLLGVHLSQERSGPGGPE